VCGVLARGTNPAMTKDGLNEPAPERAAKGVLQGYLTAKTVQWTVRLTMWALPFLVIAAYGAVAKPTALRQFSGQPPAPLFAASSIDATSSIASRSPSEFSTIVRMLSRLEVSALRLYR
jgi:hypothetical protein